MSKIIGCETQYWKAVYDHWTNYMYYDLISSLGTIYRSAMGANDVVSRNSLGSMSFGVTVDMIEELKQRTEKLAAFACTIEEEIIQEVEKPFKLQLVGTLKAAISLNPKEVTITGDQLNGGSATDTLNLKDLIMDTPLDAALKDNFEKEEEALNVDEPPESLKKLVEDNWKWMDKVSYEDMREIDRILYKGLEGAKNWNASGNPNVPADIANSAELFYQYAPYFLFKSVTSSSAYYSPSDSGVYLDMEGEKTNPRNPYTTFFHEFGHMLDNSIVEVNEGKDISKSSSKYYSSSYSEYSEEFYNNLMNDVHNYINNYSLTGSTFTDVKSAIHSELWGAKKAEFSDIFGAVTNNEYVGQYGHWDSEKSFLWFKWKESYWDYDEKEGKPAIEPVTAEAFAHFTEISVMQDPQDLEDLKTYFPTAYDTYVKMIAAQ